MPQVESRIAQAQLQAVLDDLETGTGEVTVAFYNSTNTKLVEFELSSTPFSSPTNACPSVMNASDLPILTNAESFGGTPQTIDYCLIVNEDGQTSITIGSSSIGTIGSGNPIEVTSLTVEEEQPFQLNTLTLRQPCGAA